MTRAFHPRPAMDPRGKSLLEVADSEFAINFFDSLLLN